MYTPTRSSRQEGGTRHGTNEDVPSAGTTQGRALSGVCAGGRNMRPSACVVSSLGLEQQMIPSSKLQQGGMW